MINKLRKRFIKTARINEYLSYLHHFEDRNHLICKNGYDLCVEGFPRSANSFAVRMLIYSNKSLQVAHHTHSIYNLKLAMEYEVPIIVLIRDPIDSISSYILYADIDQDRFLCALNEWVQFYKFCVRNKSKIYFVDLKKIVTDFNHVITGINDTYNTNLNVITNISEATHNINNAIKKHHTEKYSGDKMKIPIPSEERKRKKNEILKVLNETLNFKDSISLYKNILNESSL